MFRNTETGAKILDADYQHHYRMANYRKTRVHMENVRLTTASEEADEVAERVAELLEEFGAAFEALYNNETQRGDLVDAVGNETLSDIEDARIRFEDAFAGEWASEKDYVEEAIADGHFGDTVDALGTLANYLDVDSLTRDLFINDMYSINIPTGATGGGVYVFHNC
jgi:antirestriction protein